MKRQHLAYKARIIVDSACGGGRSLLSLRKIYLGSQFYLIGYDINRSYLSKAKDLMEHAGVVVDLIQASHTNLPFRLESIDVLSQTAPEPLLPTGKFGKKFAKELGRVLKNEGVYILNSSSPQPKIITELIRHYVESNKMKCEQVTINDVNEYYTPYHMVFRKSH